MRGPVALAVCLVCATPGAACGPAPASCGLMAPATCPSPAPSYAAEVEPIIRAKCVTCHAPGGLSASKPYTTLAQIKLEPLTTMISFVQSCAMPQAPAPALTADEGAALLGWLVCREPDN